MKYKVLKNISVPRAIKNSDSGGNRGESRGEQAEIYYPGAVIDLPEDKTLEEGGFVQRVKEKPGKTKTKKEDDQ